MTAKAVEHEVRQIHELLFLRDLLADRGVSPDELRRYEDAIAAARNRLAKAARATAIGLAA